MLSCFSIGTDGTYSQDGLAIGLRHNFQIVAYIELSDGTEVTYKEPKIFFVSGRILALPL